MLVIEAPDMDVNPRHIGIIVMTDAEEKEYFAHSEARHEMELELSETEQECLARVAQDVQGYSSIGDRDSSAADWYARLSR
jgi:hypothetical protein